MTPDNTFLLIGLGNPGREYRDTRHNVGFMLIDRLAVRLDARGMKVQSKAIITTATYLERKLIENMLIAHDDLDIPFGTIRIRPKGGPGGQRGMASTIEQLGTKDFPRLRIGISRPPGRMDPAAYVLQDFSREDMKILSDVLDRAADAALDFVVDGVNKAMNKYNGSQSE